MIKAVCNTYVSSELLRDESQVGSKLHTTYVNFVAPTLEAVFEKAKLHFSVDSYSISDTGDGRFLLTRVEDDNGNTVPPHAEPAYRANNKTLHLCSYMFKVESIKLM